MLPSETMIWQPEFTDKTLSRKPGAVQFHHLCIAHFRYWFRFIHPQSTVHLRQLLSTHPVGKEPEVPHHLKKLLRDVLFQPRDPLPLCQRFKRAWWFRRFSCCATSGNRGARGDFRSRQEIGACPSEYLPRIIPEREPDHHNTCTTYICSRITVHSQ